jgi:hypothetical protein
MHILISLARLDALASSRARFRARSFELATTAHTMFFSLASKSPPFASRPMPLWYMANEKKGLVKQLIAH